VFLFILAAHLSACSGDKRTFRNEGTLCVRPNAEGPNEITTSAPVVVTVLTACASSSCTSERKASCKVAAGDGTIVVESEGEYRENDGFDKPCTDDCNLDMMAKCETPALMAGSYLVTHGDDTIRFSVPTTEPPNCTRW
jgi:hypothetical protein